MLQRLNMSPGSSATRNLITHSARYGLIKGNHSAEFIEVTPDGKTALDHESIQKQKRKHFELSISRIDPFNKIFAKYRDKRLPDTAVLGDELERVGIAPNDVERGMSVLKSNLQFVGAISRINNADYITLPSEEDTLEEPADQDQQDDVPDVGGASNPPPSRAKEPSFETGAMRAPSLHIDVQVHIDSGISLEQIDKIFESMAAHLYGNRHE